MKVQENSRKSTGTVLIPAACLLLAMFASANGHAQTLPSKSPPPNADSLVISDYEKRLQDYVKLRKDAEAGIPVLKKTDSPEQIKDHQLLLASKIRADRSQATRGEYFSQDTCELFKRLVAQAYKESDPKKVKASLRHAEPVKDVPMRINAEYPEKVPLQSTPPSILTNLPPLPKGLEYRIVGQNLVLRDSEANIIVDYIPGVIPSS